VHQRLGEQVSGTLVFAILHREKANKVFGKRSSCDYFQSFHNGSSSKECIGASASRARAPGIVIKNTPPPLIDDIDDDFNIDDIDISDLAPSHRQPHL
jgi:hypothetical protein